MPYLGQRPSKGDENNFKILDDISSYTLTFDGSDSSVVSAANDTITSLTHRFVHGQRVTYNKGGGTVIAGLSDGVYYIIKEDHNTIKLATSASNATNGIAVNITGVGGGSSHTLNVAFDGINTKFKATHTNGQKAKITRSAQLVISINGVIQQPHDSATPSTGFGFDLDGTIVFSQAPVVGDVYWAHVLTNNNVTFDISDNDVDNFTGDGSTVSFNLSKTPPDNRNVLVTIDGVVQYPNDPDGTARAYTVVENVLTFTTAPASATEIQVRHIGFAGSTSGSGSGGVTSFYGRTGAVVLKSTDNVTVNDAAITGNATITGNLTVDGTTTTLDTVLTEVDKLEVAANNSTVGVAITQSGSGDILKMFSGSTLRVQSEVDGNFTIKSGTQYKGLKVLNDLGNAVGEIVGLSTINDAGAMALWTGGTKKVQLSAVGNSYILDDNLGIGTDSPNYKTTIAADGINASLSLKRLSTSVNGQAYGNIFYTTETGQNVVLVRGVRESSNTDGAFTISTKTTSGTLDERFRINSGGDLQLGNVTDAGNVLRYLDISNFNTGGSAGSILRLLTKKSDGSSSTSADIVKYKTGGLVINNNEVLGTTGFISFGTGTAGGSVTERLRITSDGYIKVSGNQSNSDYWGKIYNRGDGFSFHAADGSVERNITFYSGSATSTERLRIDSSGRVMIGNTAAGQMFSGADDLVVGTTSGARGITIVSENNSVGRILFSDSLTSGAATYQGQINYNHSTEELDLRTYTAGEITLATNNIERVRITSDRTIIGQSISNNQPTYNTSTTFVTTHTNNAGAWNAIAIISGNNTGASFVKFGDRDDEDVSQIGHYNADNSLRFYTNGGNERLRITSAGYVGIQTADPKAFFHASRPSTAAVTLNFGDPVAQILQCEDSEFALGLHNAHPFPLYIQGRTRFNVARQISLNPLGGNIGIGTLNPTTPLEVYSAASAAWKFRINTSVSDGAGFYQRANGDFEMVLRDASNNNNFISGNGGGLEFATSGTEKLRITHQGRLGLNGVAPTNSHANVTSSIHLADSNTILSRTGNQYFALFQNLKYTSADQVRYLVNGYASAYAQNTGKHLFYTSGSGTQNTAATTYERFHIANDGAIKACYNGGAFGVGGDPINKFGITTSDNNFFGLHRTNATTGTGEFNINVEANSQVTFSIDDEGLFSLGTSTDPSAQSGFSEKLRIIADGSSYHGGTIITEADLNWTHDTYQRPHIFSGVTGGNPADGVVVVASPQTNPSATRIGGLIFGCKTSSTTNVSNSGLKAVIECYTNTNVSDAWKTGAHLNFSVRRDNGELENKVQITRDGLVVRRQDTGNEGGEIMLCRPSDDTPHFHIDAFGASGTPSNSNDWVSNVYPKMRVHTGGTEIFALTTGGNIKLPHNPIFCGVYQDGASTNVNADPVIFNDTVYINKGAGQTGSGTPYNTSNGYFTCPSAGYYQVYVQAHLQDQSSTYSTWRIYHNTTIVSNAWEGNTGGGSLVASVIVNASGGDTLRATFVSTDTTQYTNETYWVLHILKVG